MCVARLPYMRDVTVICVWHDSFICVTWLVYVCDMTPLYAWHDCLFVWHDSFICETWLVRMCDMTPSFVCDITRICVTQLHYIRDMNIIPVWHDSFICVTWLVYVVRRKTPPPGGSPLFGRFPNQEPLWEEEDPPWRTCTRKRTPLEGGFALGASRGVLFLRVVG